MTTVEILFCYATPPAEAVTRALASARDVYGVRRFSFDSGARTLRVEYDATRLNAAAVAKLVREAGLDIAPETLADLSLASPPLLEPEPAA